MAAGRTLRGGGCCGERMRQETAIVTALSGSRNERRLCRMAAAAAGVPVSGSGAHRSSAYNALPRLVASSFMWRIAGRKCTYVLPAADVAIVTPQALAYMKLLKSKMTSAYAEKVTIPEAHYKAAVEAIEAEKIRYGLDGIQVLS